MALNAITLETLRYGSGVYLVALAQELANLEGVDLVLLVGRGYHDGIPAQLRSRALEVDLPASRSYWQIPFQKRIQRLLVREGVDVYHLPNTLPLFGKRVPTVVTIHDLADLRLRKYGRARTAYRRWVNATAARAADHVLTVSESSKRDLVALLKVPEEKIAVVPAGASAAFRPLDGDECKQRVRQRYGIDGDFILFPGGLLPNKNAGRALSAYARVKQFWPKLRLVVTGTGPAAEAVRLESQARRLGLAGQMMITSLVPADDMPALYNASSVVLYPSLYEGFGLPAVEAMACGVPLVTSNTSSLPEVVGDAALQVDPLDIDEMAGAVRLLLENAELRKQLRERGRQRAQRFSWSATARGCLEVYRRVAREC